MSEQVRMVESLAEIAVTVILAYVAYKIALLVDTLNSKIKEERVSR